MGSFGLAVLTFLSVFIEMFLRFLTVFIYFFERVLLFLSVFDSFEFFLLFYQFLLKLCDFISTLYPSNAQYFV